MCGDGHGHSHDGGSCASVAQPQDDIRRYDMCSYIDFEKVTVLNESVDGAGKLVFKSMENKQDRENFVESDCDPELLFNIPFSGHVKLTGIVVSGDENDTHPAKIKLFKDREAMSFDNCSVEADQEIDLKMDEQGVVDYPLKANKFGNLHHLSILVSRNFGADESKVYYIGLRGEFQHDFRQRIAIATYEARAQMNDHKNEIPDSVMRSMF